MGAPISFTCPIIDSTIQDLQNAVQILDDIIDNYNYITPSDLKDRIHEARQEIAAQYGTRSPMEEIRAANETLRSWGEQQEARADEAESNAEYYQQQLNAA